MNERTWVDLLPPPFDQDDLNVVVVLTPKDAKFRVRKGVDRVANKPVHVGFIAFQDTEKAVQVTVPAIDSYFDQMKLCNANGYPMAPPLHIGRLLDLPQAFMMEEEFILLVFQRDNMADDFINLNREFSRLTKEGPKQ